MQLTKHIQNKDIRTAIEDAWLNIDVKAEKIKNPLHWPTQYDEDPIPFLMWQFTRPDYLWMICKEILNIELTPMQILILKELWQRKFPMLIQTRGGGKSFMLALYSLLRCLLIPNRKVIICAAAFRQSKNLFQYIERIYDGAPILKDILKNSEKEFGARHEPDQWSFKINGGSIIACPTGTGETIRGLRANDLITDEFNSLPKEIFETVMAGFTAVRSDPVDSMKYQAAIAKAKELGYELQDKKDEFKLDNQLIISGTAGFTFQHFYEYWKDYRDIILSKGDTEKLKDYFARRSELSGQSEAALLKHFEWRDYSIIRIPFELMPEGFMDEAQIARARATMHSGTYGSEYGAIFASDSNGFFKRSLIDSCTVKNSNINTLSSQIEGLSLFSSELRGSKNKTYVMGVDPASEADSFAIVIIELHETHRRVVYGWTTNKRKHRALLKKGLIDEDDFYSYCAIKMRQLKNMFPCERIMVDSQGGGIAIAEALHDKDKIPEGEAPWWPIVDHEKPQDTDDMVGEHILELVNFADAKWTSDANHGLRKDMEDKVLLFPYFDPVVLAAESGKDELEDRLYDTRVDALLEIEELKDELCTIVITRTANSNRDRWDTPEQKLPGGKKGRMRKDRYSALVMANMGARQIARTIRYDTTVEVGGFAQVIKEPVDGPMYGGSEMARKLSEVAKYY